MEDSSVTLFGADAIMLHLAGEAMKGANVRIENDYFIDLFRFLILSAYCLFVFLLLGLVQYFRFLL